MKKIIISLLVAVFAVLMLAACSGKDQQSSNGGTADDSLDVYKTETSDSYEDESFNYNDDAEITNDENADELNADDANEKTISSGFERAYELTNLEIRNPDTGEWSVTDFIEGAETYVFHEDLSCEYIYRNYPTYDDMLNDSNYEMVNKQGIYMYVPGEEGISMVFENFISSGRVSDEEMVLDFEYNGSPAVRATYTKTSMEQSA